ncbi:MAG: DUF1059 domain-containing protein [Anaerolineae bacterium]|nr:DUF1059 domain-containing protein [Anaerolineae bacterium]
MAMTITCPFCDHRITADSEDQVMREAAEHMRSVHNREPTESEKRMIREQLSTSAGSPR